MLIKVPEKTLRAYADSIDFKMRLDPIELRKAIETGSPGIKPVTINEDPEYCAFNPFDYIYGRYENSVDPNLYLKVDPRDGAFSAAIRYKLSYYILEAPRSLGGCNLSLTKLIKKKRVLALFPMHDQVKRSELQRCWLDASVMPWQQPLDDVKDYFGEKIALYFAFMGHYTGMLILPAIVGLAFQLVVWGTDDFSHPVLPFFCVLISVWSVTMLELWKREEKMVGLRWGTVDFEEDEPERPQFNGTIIKSYVDGADVKYFPPAKKHTLIAQSVTLVSSLILLVLGCVTSIYILRFHLYSSIGSNASTVASAINSVQITILNMVYGIVATKLTQRENHRTDTEYEDSLIAKTFVFQFVNSYASFYYLAFIAPYLPRPPQLSDTGVEGGFVGECGFDNCMKPLALNLGIIFGTSLTVNNFIEIVSPLISNHMKAKAESKGTDGAVMTPPEREYLLLPYDVMTENMKDYAEVAVQYGYMTIFIVCLPISCFVSLINNYCEVKVDGWKLLNVHQRPIPKAAEDIGNWQAVFSVISLVAIVTNAGLICFTMSVLEDFDFSTRVWIFFAFQWVMILAQRVIAYLIPDEPADFITQRLRTRFLVSKVIDRVPDEPDDEDIMGEEEGEEERSKPQYQAYSVALGTYPKAGASVEFVEVHVR